MLWKRCIPDFVFFVDKPSAPLNIKTPTLNDPKISWDKPAAGGNDPSLVYIVEYCSIANSKCNKITTNETSVTLKLDENTDYTVVITAKNSRGMLASKTMPFKIDASTTTSGELNQEIHFILALTPPKH